MITNSDRNLRESLQMDKNLILGAECTVQRPASLYRGQEHKKMNIGCLFFFNWLSCPVWKCLYSSWVFYIYSHFPSSVSNYREQAITCYPGKQRRDLEKERRGEKEI